MRPTEAEWLRHELEKLPVAALSPLLELGSSTNDFRTRFSPHIDALVHQPLRARGVRIVHTDLKAEPGVDIAGDIYDPDVRGELLAVGAKAVLCANMLEHVETREVFAATCASLVPRGGYLIVTVPFSYPYHADPIDTLFRPRPADIAALFPEFTQVAGAIVADRTYFQELWAKGPGVFAFENLRSARKLLSKPGSRRWRQVNHRLLWAFRPYQISWRGPATTQLIWRSPRG